MVQPIAFDICVNDYFMSGQKSQNGMRTSLLISSSLQREIFRSICRVVESTISFALRKALIQSQFSSSYLEKFLVSDTNHVERFFLLF